MEHSVQLKYGTRSVSFAFGEKPDIFTIREPRQNVSEAKFSAAIGEMLQSSPLDLSRVSVVVGDKTRLCGYAVYLPVLMRALESAGADLHGLAVYIAYGTHSRQAEVECAAAYGDVYGRYRFEHHDCGDENQFVDLGKTSRGTPVLVTRPILETSCLITFGAICHHYFAGYGGGRKLIFPGLGFKGAIYRNHGLFLDTQTGSLAAGCRPGVLDGNPLAEDLAEYERFRPADVAIHGILDSRGRVCDLLPGRGTEHFRAACAIHGSHCEIAHSQLYDIVFASCGGYPKDINFIQSHKAIHNAAHFVRDGGTLVVLAECPDGIGSNTFLPWFQMGGWQAAFNRLSQEYEGNGGTALAMMSKLGRMRILMATELDESYSNLIGFEKITVKDALRIAENTKGSLAVIPNASLLVKKEGA